MMQQPALRYYVTFCGFFFVLQRTWQRFARVAFPIRSFTEFLPSFFFETLSKIVGFSLVDIFYSIDG